MTDARFVVHHGDNMAILPTLADCSVDAIVTDPPAGIAFMGKAWDSDKGGRDAWIAWLSEVMGQCLRVLKPGGHALVWAIPRTSHWTGMAIENAGFEVRDRIAHCFGSGFPKSLDVSKAIDKVRDWSKVERLNGEIRRAREAAGLSLKQIGEAMQKATADQYGAWYHRGGHMFFETGRALPSRPEWECLRAVLPIAPEFQTAYEEAEREVIAQRTTGIGTGKGATPIMGDGSRDITASATEAARQWQGWGTALKPAIEDWWLARKPLVGNVAQNVMAHGTGALNIDKCRIDGDAWKAHRGTGLGSVKFFTEGDRTVYDKEPHALGRWPANLIHSGEPEVLAAFPQAAASKSGGVAGWQKGGYVGGKYEPIERTGYSDTGSAARFFMQCPPDEATSLYYTPKASRADRDKGNTHSTVKPIALMRYLCRLITPPDGVVLDPFAGSGSSGQAAMFEGFRFIGIEQDAGHVELARHRVGLAARNGWQPGLELEFAA